MIALLGFAFLSGLVTIFAPCIWPLLPIILSSTTTGGKRKPLGITVGLMTSFTLSTLAIAALVRVIPFDADVIRIIAVVVIGLLGLTLLIPSLSRVLEGAVSRLSGKLGARMNMQESHGFGGGFASGFALGLIWTPCAGPILATIAFIASTQAISWQVILITLTFAVGVGIPLFLFATLGQLLFTKSRALNKYTGRIQQVFGAVMILTAIAIATGYDKTLQSKLLDRFPGYATFIVNLESNQSVKDQLKSLKNR